MRNAHALALVQVSLACPLAPSAGPLRRIVLQPRSLGSATTSPSKVGAHAGLNPLRDGNDSEGGIASRSSNIYQRERRRVTRPSGPLRGRTSRGIRKASSGLPRSQGHSPIGPLDAPCRLASRCPQPP